MKNKILRTFKSDSDFSDFINSRYKNPIPSRTFPADYEKRRPPLEMMEDVSKPEVRKIVERELIRDNIFVKYEFDIYEFPFVVFYENGNSKEILKPFKNMNKAEDYCSKLLIKDIHSLLISVMNIDIECRLIAN